MEKIDKIRAVADLSYEDDPENEHGYVAEVGNILLAKSYCNQLAAAGFTATWTVDENLPYQHAYVWVMYE